MASSSPNKLFDPIRHRWVEATPEEKVRQALIGQLIQLGYPASLLTIEKALDQLPHLTQKSIPNRRLDLLCYGQKIHPDHPLYPLLLIECKAHAPTDQALHQVMGYNHYVGAYFVAVAGPEKVRLGWYDKNQLHTAEHLPSYAQLLQAVGQETQIKP